MWSSLVNVVLCLHKIYIHLFRISCVLLTFVWIVSTALNESQNESCICLPYKTLNRVVISYTKEQSCSQFPFFTLSMQYTICCIFILMSCLQIYVQHYYLSFLQCAIIPYSQNISMEYFFKCTICLKKDCFS